MHADAAAGGDEDIAVVQGVGEVGQAVIRARRGRIDFGGALHVERLVRPFLVEFLYEIVEAGLLLKAVQAWRAGRLHLQGEVHALVAAVLLRMTWFNTFDRDAEPEPPDGEFGEVEQGIRAGEGEGNAVVGADGLRQAAVAKEPLESRDGEVLAGRLQGLA